MRETWYVLEDGAVADPNDVAPDEAGALRHKSGIAVALRGAVPHTIGVDDAEAERARQEPVGAGGGDDPQKDMKPEAQRGGYKTRESKAK